MKTNGKCTAGDKERRGGSRERAEAHMSPALNESSVLQRFEHGKAVEIRNGVMFNLPMTATYVVQVGILIFTLVLYPRVSTV